MYIEKKILSLVMVVILTVDCFGLEYVYGREVGKTDSIGSEETN